MPFPVFNQCERLLLKFRSSENPEVIDAKLIQKTIGLIALFWPLILFIGHFVLEDRITFQSSISHYYHSGMDHFFTSGLVVIGMSMLAYKGFHKIDGTLGNIAGIFAILVAFFPTDEVPSGGFLTGSWCSIVHYISAFLLFMTLAYFCIVIFTLGHDNRINIRYKLCGWCIVLCIIGMVLDILIFEKSDVTFSNGFGLFLFLELLTLWAFGISWLIKGNLFGIMRDSGVPEGYKERVMKEYNDNCKNDSNYEELYIPSDDQNNNI